VEWQDPQYLESFLKKNQRLMRKIKIYTFVTILIITVVKNKQTVNYLTYSINH